jgi:chromosome segregation protein
MGISIKKGCENLQLKSLEIQGFKSFPDKTTITFVDGITAVVGPNGSGKSNISDAIRWVLGEQSSKSLRGNKMEDVVFGGTQLRKALGFAEVSLTVDNTARLITYDADDITITRRYYRSGESEYRINNISVRLKDLHELFMDTGLGRDGYSMIGQGRIAEIVGAKSDERREIFEEAAGISKFRYRKEESERRLAAAEENLVRLRDILTELENRLEPLREQSEKAKEYIEYANEKKTLEIGLWLVSLNKSKDVLRDQEYKLVSAKAQHDGIEESLLKLEQEIENTYSSIQQKNAQVDELRRLSQIHDEEAAKKSSDISVLENDILRNNEVIMRINSDITSYVESGESTGQQIEERKGIISTHHQEIEELTTKLNNKQQDLSGLLQSAEHLVGEIEQNSRKLAEVTLVLSDAKVMKSTSQSTLDELNNRLSAIEVEKEQKYNKQEQLKDSLASCVSVLAGKRNQLEGLKNSENGYSLKLNSRVEKLAAMDEKLRSLGLAISEKKQRANMLADLEKHLEGFAHSVKLVMREVDRGQLNGVHGPVSRLIKVPPEYAVAIETALGGALQNIVVNNEQDAKNAIQLLKQQDAGRATFLPLTSIKGFTLDEKDIQNSIGFVGFAYELIQFENKYDGIIKSLLGKVVVADELDSAIIIAKRYNYRFRIVTLDGQVINAGGSLTGGSLAKNAGLLSRAGDIEKLNLEAETLTKQLDEQKEVRKLLSAEVSSLEAELLGLCGEIKTNQEDIIRLEGEEQRLSEQLSSTEIDYNALDAEYNNSTGRIKGLTERISEAEAKITLISAQASVIENSLSELSGGQHELTTMREEQSQAIADLKMNIVSTQKDIETQNHLIAELTDRQSGQASRIDVMRAEIAEIEQRSEESNQKITRLLAESQDLKNLSSEKIEGISELIEGREGLEKSATELRAAERSKAEERENIGRELARLEERKNNIQVEYDTIIARLWDEYELTRTEAEAQAIEITEPAKAQRRLTELKNKIKSLGNVNVAAIDEYREIFERYNFMNAQVQDVENSRDSLRSLIHDITSQMRTIFVEQFNIINKNFNEVFVELFGGGNAELRLTEIDDVLESGIEIIVAPPGKIIRNLASLSGGEQAFVAIAIYFAILKVRPSPFCVLDEIEAALDDVNVSRFAKYLRKMSNKSQFIIITHRRGTMEEADMLYGVTMQDEGVSKLLALHITEIEKHMKLT